MYYYEGNTTIVEYDDPIGGPIESRDKYTYDDAGNLVREEWDNDADGTIDALIVWIFNADGCLIRKEVDYQVDQELEDFFIYERDRFCNLLQSWQRNAGGVENLEVSDFSCWLE